MNILSHNIWSGGEYLKNFQGITPTGVTLELSSDWSYIGNTSLKMTTSNETINKIVIDTQYTEVGKTVTASMHCLNMDSIVTFKFYQLTAQQNVLNAVTIDIPVSSNVQNMTGTMTTLNNIKMLRLVIESNIQTSNHSIFLDNIKIL